MHSRNPRALRGVLYSAATVVALGCGGQQLSYAPVSGVVTVDGAPVNRAEVVLSCDDVAVEGARPTSRGVTDDAGRFSLRSLTPDKRLVDGAVVGHHRVFVTTRIVQQDELGRARVVREELLGPGYTRGQELSVDVPPEGLDDLRFELPAK